MGYSDSGYWEPHPQSPAHNPTVPRTAPAPKPIARPAKPAKPDARVARAEAEKARKAEALTVLIHFVGDVHQPLHAADNRDRGGNQIQLTGQLREQWDVQGSLALAQAIVVLIRISDATNGPNGISGIPSMVKTEYLLAILVATFVVLELVHRSHFGRAAKAVRLDVTASPWPVAHADAIVCINMVHIAPWEAALALFAAGAGMQADAAAAFGDAVFGVPSDA